MSFNFYTDIHNKLSENRDKIYLKWPVWGKSYDLFSGQEILEKVASVYSSLENKKIKKGEKVVIAIQFSPALIFAVLGTMAYGAIPVLPPAATQRVGMLKLLFQEKINVVFINAGLGTRICMYLFGIKTIFSVSGNENLEIFQPREVSKDQAALISFTSGSMGKPKMVFRAHKILKAQHIALKKSFPPKPDQHDFPLFPNILLHNLSLGITTVIPDIPNLDVTKMVPATVLAQIQNEKVDSLTGNVFYFKKLLADLEQNAKIFPNVKEIGIGGSPVPEDLPHLLKKYFINARIYIIYGSTQAEPIAVRMVQEQKDPVLGYFVGTLHPDITLRLTSSEEIKAGGKYYMTGHIEVKGNHVVLEKKDQEWLETGDYGYINENQELFLTGRLGNHFVIQGYSHYQIENLLATLSSVKQVAAIANNCTYNIYYDGDIDPEEIRKVLDVVPGSIIKEIRRIEKLPVDSRHHSKILYHTLCIQNLNM